MVEICLSEKYRRLQILSLDTSTYWPKFTIRLKKMNERKYRTASDKYNSGEKINLEELIILGLDLDDAFRPDDLTGNSIIECPKIHETDCEGTLILRESKYDYGPYIGCGSKACNFYLTIKQLKECIEEFTEQLLNKKYE